MHKISFPQLLENLLEDSELLAPIRSFADCCGEILDDKQMPFFPSYSDHSCEHINQVLQAEVDLIPLKVWEKGVLRPEDAAVLIGGTLLHDIAMHLHPDGFLELVSENSRFQPLPWFEDEQQGHKADRPWRELWLDYQREARRFSDGKLEEIIGMDAVRRDWKFASLPESRDEWHDNHKLIIGEFIRRHHARLAHEIALFGFPGVETGHGIQQFPALAEPGHPLEHLADLIGLTARSHGLNLRTCQAYLESRYGKRGPRHRGCAVLYPMALLRVADYLQIDRRRTPAILLKLRNPQSHVSVQEWQKHLALLNIDDAHDPWGKSIEVSGQISHGVYLQLRELLDGLQKEMDHATAVLDEAYGRHPGLDHLGLATRRVHSNLTDPAFRASLPFVPERTGYSTDPNLLTLLVGPLYGKEPGVGVRELMQNSVDAVRELHAWCEAHGKQVEGLDLPDQEADVQIDFIQREDESWFLRVTDKGIGMTADTIQNYFLRAGASFRQSPEWTKEFVDDDGKPKVLRAGRFGIGAFAIFLLGPRFRLWTRHVTADEMRGFYLKAEGDSNLIEIQRVDGLDVGTTVEVDITSESGVRKYIKNTDWYCWSWPVVSRRLVQGANIEVLAQRYTVPLRETNAPLGEWSVIHPKGFDAVYWTFMDYPNLICNGLSIFDPDFHRSIFDREPFLWPKEIQMERPRISVLDGDANLPLTAQRYALSDRNLPFIDELSRDVTLSFIAHALVCGPTCCTGAHMLGKQCKPHPLVIYEKGGIEAFRNSLLRWCCNSSSVIPADPWLYSLLQTDSCLISGEVAFDNAKRDGNQDVFLPLQPHEYQSTITWNGTLQRNSEEELQENLREMGEFFPESAENGFYLFDNYSVICVEILLFVSLKSISLDELIWMFEEFDYRKSCYREIAQKNTNSTCFLFNRTYARH